MKLSKSMYSSFKLENEEPKNKKNNKIDEFEFIAIMNKLNQMTKREILREVSDPHKKQE